MSTKLDTRHTSPNQNSRPGKPKFIVIHHWGSRGQKFANVLSWLCNPAADVSAHYVAGDGQRARIVALHKRAWHAGTDYGNDYGVGIECRPEATDSDYALVAACIREIRAQYGNLPLRPHSSFVATACPGVWDLEHLDRLARGAAAPAPAPTVSIGSAPPFPLPRRPGRMYYYGSPDGPITSVSGRGLNTAVPADVQKIGGRWRSHGLAKWQQRMRDRGYSIEADGRFGAETERIVRYFQKLIGQTVDGKIGPATWAAAWAEPVR